MRCGIVGMWTRSVEVNQGITSEIAHVPTEIVHELPHMGGRLEKVPAQYRSNGRKSQPPVTLGLLRTEATRRPRLACHEDNARSRPMRPAGSWTDWRGSNRLSAPTTSDKH